MKKDEFADTLIEYLGREGIPFSSKQAALCREHVLLMLEWNRRTNLTRITDLREILVKHLLDSLLPSLRLPCTGPALDVGTGPGFPGVPLKILHDGLDMVLLESNRKKVSFLKVLLSRLNIERIHVIEGRWEDLDRLPGPVGTSGYGLITMRAVRLEPEHLSRLALRSLKPGGIFAWWAGPSAGSEYEGAETVDREGGLAFRGAPSYVLPVLKQLRRVFIWEKVDEAG
ncbi:MAG: 16S rRNA (guanine(527)-N(7))-methyltransferase RsmG [Syntrophobacteraceae bacterium]|jgi:16S rRNA (guanine527-N7)-methyltransferase|nr:16S rRNA (guanine(527)-N(7))-methyltransferase RsmG [Syntrophobacteraceae bacterium]